jgi:hypothetical protein
MLGGFMPRCAGFNHLDNALTHLWLPSWRL